MFIRGAVRKPGYYPISAGTTLDMALAAAGGLSLEADTRNIEPILALPTRQPSNIRRPRRRLTINMREMIRDHRTHRRRRRARESEIRQNHRKIQQTGKVKRSYRYDLLPGDKLSDLLSRGGTRGPCPGAIFSRAAERKAEEARSIPSPHDPPSYRHAAGRRGKRRPSLPSHIVERA